MANIEFKTLEQFMPYWCQKILPAVYDDSLSYYQLLGRILQKYNEVIEIVNKHSETLVDHENRITLTEQQIVTLTKKVEELDAQVKQNTANIAALTERVNAHDTQIEALENWLNSFKSFGGERYATINETTHELKLFMGLTSSALAFAKWKSAIDTASAQDFVIVGGGNSVGQILLHSKSASSFSAFGFLIEDGDLHFFRATYSTQGSAADTGATTDWREVELLDITNIKQALGNSAYDTLSQKVLTQLINSKLNHDMGITGATAGQYINIAEVDDDGKPVTYGFGTPGGGGAGVDIVQTTGQSTTSVMSQDATTKAINAVKTNADAGATAANQMAASVVYPTTAGGTNGKFVDANGTTLTRTQLLAALIGADGRNTVFTVKKTGATSWDRITWFKASKGEGLYDFAWYETDGINAKAGVDRLTMATNGQFAVAEQSSVDIGGGGGAPATIAGTTIATMTNFTVSTSVSTQSATLVEPYASMTEDDLKSALINLAAPEIVDASTGELYIRMGNLSSAGDYYVSASVAAASRSDSAVLFKVIINCVNKTINIIK